MALVTDKHFAANIVMSINDVHDNSAFRQMLEEISFTEFRYPGGSVTENATWENGQMQQIFGPPIEPNDPTDDSDIMTMREALAFCQEKDVPMNIVIPTKQFYDFKTGEFIQESFDRYVVELEKALAEFPEVKISGFEIGNEYWGHDPEKGFQRFTPAQYAEVVNNEVPQIKAMAERLDALDGKKDGIPKIGVQAGAQWRESGVEESKEIIAGIDDDVRGMIGKVYQHHYPNVNKNSNYQTEWAFKAVQEFEKADGFPDDLEVVISEFNLHGDVPKDSGKDYVYGTRLAGEWAEEFGEAIDAGADRIHTWGLQYGTLANKLYDKEVDANGKEIIAATPLGMIYDISREHLVGKSTMTDAAAKQGLGVPKGVNITGFENDEQRVVYLHNISGAAATINLSEEIRSGHVTAHVMMPSDDPDTEKDESLTLSPKQAWPDSRADMRVTSGEAVGDTIEIPKEGIVVLIISDDGVGVNIEGEHHETDSKLGMAKDILIGGDGRDTLSGHVGNDVLAGAGGNDTLDGGAGKDVLISDAGKDTMSDEEGSNLFIVTGSAKDTRVDMAGGSNTILTTGAAAATVYGFTQTDTLGLNGVFSDKDAFMKAISEGKDATTIKLPNGSVISLEGYTEGADMLSGQIFDFNPEDEARDLIDKHLAGLTDDQKSIVIEHGEDVGNITGGQDVWHEPGHTPDPDPKDDPDEGEEETEQDGSSGGGGGCFVATAAYGHRMHPEVVALRRFRDQHLIRYSAGRAFIRFYWKVGPLMASRVSPKSSLAKGLRVMLGGFVRVLRARQLTDGK